MINGFSARVCFILNPEKKRNLRERKKIAKKRRKQGLISSQFALELIFQSNERIVAPLQSPFVCVWSSRTHTVHEKWKQRFREYQERKSSKIALRRHHHLCALKLSYTHWKRALEAIWVWGVISLLTFVSRQ